LDEVVARLHFEHGVDAGEAIDHHRDKRAIAQPDRGWLRRVRLALASSPRP
jgi:hypothetical protein